MESEVFVGVDLLLIDGKEERRCFDGVGVGVEVWWGYSG